MSFVDRNRKALLRTMKTFHEKTLRERTEYEFFGDTTVYVKDEINGEVDLDYVLSRVKHLIPSSFLKELDIVYIGQFQDLIDKQVNAAYDQGALYITNDQDDNEDLIDDFVHEIAHAVEEKYGPGLYGDGKIELEFLGKRKRLFQVMRQEIDEDMTNMAKYFTDVEYDVKFDDFLYKIVGYPMLTSLTMGLFISPYGVTSIREYFATGFEEYYLKDRKYLQNISPAIYKKIYELENEV